MENSYVKICNFISCENNTRAIYFVCLFQNSPHLRHHYPPHFLCFTIIQSTHSCYSGCSLHFATVTSSPSKVVMTTTGLVFSGRVHNSNISDSSKKLSEWRELLPGAEVPFEFKQSREKQRHKVRLWMF